LKDGDSVVKAQLPMFQRLGERRHAANDSELRPLIKTLTKKYLKLLPEELKTKFSYTATEPISKSSCYSRQDENVLP